MTTNYIARQHLEDRPPQFGCEMSGSTLARRFSTSAGVAGGSGEIYAAYALDAVEQFLSGSHVGEQQLIVEGNYADRTL